MLFLGGCVGAAFYNVYCKGLMQKFNERDILIYSYITATPASLPILLWKEPDSFQRLLQLDTSAWFAFVFLVLLVYGITMLMLFYVLQFLPVTVVLASTYLIPVFGIVIGMTLLNDRLNLYQIVGSIIVLTATVLIMKFEADSLPESEDVNPSLDSKNAEIVVET
jgi:drug/metabolite transporter (DMT)-like permease